MEEKAGLLLCDEYFNPFGRHCAPIEMKGEDIYTDLEGGLCCMCGEELKVIPPMLRTRRQS